MGIGGTIDEEMEVQKEEMVHRESPGSRRQSGDGGPIFMLCTPQAMQKVLGNNSIIQSVNKLSWRYWARLHA